ncbi:MAG: polymerase [Synechococcaceae cyanobacterium SM2_3_1]|nr:polymerase [Synechococcaceae cyanobacterium SM2_3_1]
MVEQKIGVKDPEPEIPRLGGQVWHGFRSGGWLQGALACLPINLLPSLVLMLGGTLNWVGQRDKHLDRLSWMSLAAIGWVGLVTILAPDLQTSVPGSFNYWPFLLFFLPCSQVLRSAWLRLRLLQIIGVGSLLVSGLGLGQVVWGWEGRLEWGVMVVALRQSDRPVSIFTSANTLAIYLVLVLAIMGGLFLAGRSRGLALLAGGMGILLLALTASRNGWGIAWVALLLFLVLRRWWWGIGGLLGLSLMPVGAALGIPGLRWVVPQALWQRLADTIDPSAAFYSSTANRLHAWSFAVDMIQERPWQGWGWQSFAELYRIQDPPPAELLGHCHQLYLTLAAEGGIPVLLIFLGIWGWTLMRGWQAWWQAPAAEEGVLLGVNLALVSYFMSGWLDAVYFDGRINLLVWVLLAWINGAWLDQQRSAGTPVLSSEAETALRTTTA